MHDVTVQPDRADTWAAMALARKSRLENKLNAVTLLFVDLLLTTELISVSLALSYEHVPQPLINENNKGPAGNC